MMSVEQHCPLVKKHSQSDLVSRLKSRRVLGMGVKAADGEFHRSKISQMLGNEFKFAFHEPFGLRFWQFMSALTFSALGLLTLTFPRSLGARLDTDDGGICVSALRLHGAAMIMTLTASADQDVFSRVAAVQLVAFGLSALLSLFYYVQVGRKPRKV
ncbi:tumor protein p53-inducible protein 11-like isoform X2 [Amblyraja radiata]|uniref:tumor protein p53-inducible protein 11-like isoform X2 n=1 Tax=Amblyraja radiata TaxID=386614 RepID=UPI0014028175|nr:tumor protein p53-inducible protein 11-like isoform X2 [Amblyraja radiata]